MASATNKPFHTYENVVYDDQASSNHYATPQNSTSTTLTTTTVATNTGIAVNKTAIESPFPDPLNGKVIQ